MCGCISKGSPCHAFTGTGASGLPSMPISCPSSTSGRCEAMVSELLRTADEAACLARQHVGLVAVRRVPAARDHEQLGLRHAACDGADLLEGAVFVVFALHGQHGAADRLDFGL